MKKLTSILLGFLLSLNFLQLVFAETAAPVPISVIVRADCAHCKEEKAFLEVLQKTRTDIRVILHDIDTPEGKSLFDQLTDKEKLSKATPITLVGNTIVQGFDLAETTGKRITELVDSSIGKKTFTIPEYLAAETSGTKIEQVASGTCDATKGTCPATSSGSELTISIPFIGVIDLKSYSLPAIASLLGFVDGFNPCAMWVLVTFLIVLLEIGDRRLMWKVAGLFIAAETIMYYLILNVWFTTWDFIGLDRIVTPIVGVVAMAAGLYFIYESLKNKGQCTVTNLQQRSKIHHKIKSIASSPFTIITAIGIIGLALSVNIIEFACSIGIPQTFTKIIQLNGLGAWETQGLMAIYIFFYMIDDFFVFGLALWGAEHLHLTSTYSKWSQLLGGGLMIILGYLLVFNPEILRF